MEISSITERVRKVADKKTFSKEVSREEERAVIDEIREVVPQINFLPKEEGELLYLLGNVLHRFELSEDEKELFRSVFLARLEEALVILHNKQPIFGSKSEEEIEESDRYLRALNKDQERKERNEYSSARNIADALITGLSQMKETKIFRLLEWYPKAIRGLNDHGITVAVYELLPMLSRKKIIEIFRAAIDCLDDKTLCEEACSICSRLLFHSEVFLPQIAGVIATEENNQKEA